MSSLACCISESLFDGETTFILCTHMNYKVLQVPSVQLQLDFAYKGQRRVMWLPTVSLVHFCWNQALPMRRLLSKAGRVYSCQVGGSDTTLEKGTGGFGWASRYGPHRRQNLHRLPKQQTPKDVSLPRWKAAPMTPWEMSCITSNAHIKTLHPVPKTHLVF